MKFHYQTHSLKPGIYKILNTHTNRIYIGQCLSFKNRWYDHKRSLLSGKHQNKFLLNDFNKCFEELGHNDFLEFHVIEVMEGSTKEERNQREEEWVAKFWDKQNLCYNFKQKANEKKRSCYSNTPEETKQLIAQNSQKMWDVMSDEEKLKRMERTLKARREKKDEIAKKVSKANTGKKMSAERIEAMRVRSPKGSEHRLYRVPNFWGHHNAETIEKIRQTSLGRKQTKGTLQKRSGENHWTAKNGGFSEESKKKMSESHSKWKKSVIATQILSGEEITYSSIGEASRILNIFKSNVTKALSGKYSHAKGFKFRYLETDL